MKKLKGQRAGSASRHAAALLLPNPDFATIVKKHGKA
jgi:hypothetical protein